MSGATANGDELVAVYDEAGVAIGRARRAEVRDQGLWHAGGMVLVRSQDGESVYVHQRAPDKDVFPGAYDCWAGGLVAAGESPAECAVREVAEELGVTGVQLHPLFSLKFEEPPIRCHNFAFEVRWGGPIVHQPEEIVSGQWLALDELQRWANDPRTPLVPDGRLCIQQWFHLRK